MVAPQLFIDAVNSYSNFVYALPFNKTIERWWMHFHGVAPDLCCDLWTRTHDGCELGCELGDDDG